MAQLPSKATCVTKEEESRTNITSHNCKILLLSNPHIYTLGHMNQEIAARLFISVRTVDSHRAHIMLKLRLETRAKLVMFALANGVIGP